MVRKKAPEQVPGRFTAVPHLVLDSVAFRGASHPAKALLYEVMRQHTGSNNGHFQLANSWLRTRGWTSAGVIQRAKRELVERQLIVNTKMGGLNAGPDLWALTWFSVSDWRGLDLRHGQFLPGAWNQFVATPKQKRRSVGRNGAVPRNGTDATSTIPANGAKTALLADSAIPSNGNNVSTNVPHLRSTTKRIVGKPGKSGTGKASTLTA
jgi:hypothetical protein